MDHEVQPPLISACYSGKIDLVKSLLAAQVDINQQNKDGNTALIIATQAKHYHIVKLLLEAGADINKYNRKNQTAFICSLNKSKHKPKITRLLLKAGANPNDLINNYWRFSE